MFKSLAVAPDGVDFGREAEGRPVREKAEGRTRSWPRSGSRRAEREAAVCSHGTRNSKINPEKLLTKFDTPAYNLSGEGSVSRRTFNNTGSFLCDYGNVPDSSLRSNRRCLISQFAFASSPRAYALSLSFAS